MITADEWNMCFNSYFKIKYITLPGSLKKNQKQTQTQQPQTLHAFNTEKYERANLRRIIVNSLEMRFLIEMFLFWNT